MLRLKTTLQKQHFSYCTTITHTLSVVNKNIAFAILIFLLPSTPLIVLFYFTIFLVGITSIIFLSSWSPHTSGHAHLLLPFTSYLTLFSSCFWFGLWCHFLICTLFSVLSSTWLPFYTYCMPTTRNFISFSPEFFLSAISDLHSTVSVSSTSMLSND